ncbi:MAG TPA: choice-of-anchor V domain-containing protein [Longimicrobiaceae bacterium]|nr:choice-of-anchor V domain-containing protein [Longimicrobiaceae bacterium]
MERKSSKPGPALSILHRWGWPVVAAVGVWALVAAAPNPAYREGPPPGFSGGFGEASCSACHFSSEDNTGPGVLSIEGLPATYVPAKGYPLVLTLARSGMAISGFVLTARFAEDGAQGGTLAIAPGEAARAGLVTDREVQYAFQLAQGAQVSTPDTARWTVLWTAPDAGGAIQLNVAANAADGDGTAEGDEVYTTRVTIPRHR